LDLAALTAGWGWGGEYIVCVSVWEDLENPTFFILLFKFLEIEMGKFFLFFVGAACGGEKTERVRFFIYFRKSSAQIFCFRTKSQLDAAGDDGGGLRWQEKKGTRER
jgi:hypothetical protein